MALRVLVRARYRRGLSLLHHYPASLALLPRDLGSGVRRGPVGPLALCHLSQCLGGFIHGCLSPAES